MKFTQVLYKIHLGRMVKRNWFFHTKQILAESGSESTLTKMGIPVFDPEEILNPPKTKIEYLFIYINNYLRSFPDNTPSPFFLIFNFNCHDGIHISFVNLKKLRH